ncbi:hypothetical protein CHLNCDRAFT_143650 [Chlorella variabilis]|uniref:Wax synthase domain-containing protein n=1 Tax=Chlorella variabilis TaxID=554065 RepID=E1ZA63_CHLVA|nr:hypothetical protein CHLNCDRAFT_143650 [Chlorella variabilis]EFN57210.1 hypothetical protein CHLNCDRAFT_143650 [Chlorella variabilis]|eukprot:XP_005849312.1 hypothetical protein CHLNCDRAFT_143650 [Chlorella variabilis]
MAEELCHTSLGITYAQALGYSLAALLGCGLWLWAWGRCLQPGPWRLAAAAPVVALNFALPKLFCRWEDSTTIVFSWAVNRGSLCMQPFSPSQFVAAYIFPITPLIGSTTGSPPLSTTATDGMPAEPVAAAATDSKAANGSGSSGGDGDGAAQAAQPRGASKGRLSEDAGSLNAMLAAWLAKNAGIAFLVWLLQHPLPGLLESFVYGLALYALLSLIMDGPAALVIGATGLRVSPHFDRPWRSTSVASFWSKRWDLAAGNTLRQLVYDSVVDGSLMAPPAGVPQARPTALRQLVGSLASFGASGLFHEFIFWYLTGHTTRGVWLSFFLAQAPIIVAERLALSALKRRGILLPDWLRVCVSMLLVVATAQHLFWAPCKKHGVADSVVNNVHRGIQGTMKSAGLIARA